MKNITVIHKLIENSELSTKVQLYFGTPVVGDDYDPYEKNLGTANLNPLTIRAYVREISAKSLVWRQMGLQEMGAQELYCKAKFRTMFETATRIVIDGDNYSVFKEGTGGNAVIQKQPFNVIKVILTRAS